MPGARRPERARRLLPLAVAARAWHPREGQRALAPGGANGRPANLVLLRPRGARSGQRHQPPQAFVLDWT